MYEKQIEFPFMKREKDYEVTINYKGFSYRGYKRLQFTYSGRPKQGRSVLHQKG